VGPIMVIVLACDCPAKAARLRQALERSGYNCPLGNVVAVEAAGKASHKPDVVLVVLTADHEQAQADIKRVRETVDVPILAIGPRDPNLILCAVRAGANDFVDEAGDLHGELSTAICRLSTVGPGRAALGRLHTVVAASGGCGRTLLATNLAVALAKVNTRCALFDFDMGTGDVATVMDLKPLHTVADLCRNVDKLDQKMFEQSLIEHTSGVSVLAAPETWDAVSQVTVEGLEKVLRYGRTLFPTVVVDLNAFWLAEFTQLLQQSSTIFLLCRLDLSTIRNARRALEHFDRIRVNRDNVQLVAARTGRPKEISANQAELVLDRSFDHSIPEDSSTANLCINCGVPLVVESPSCSVTKAIACIAKSAARGCRSGAGDLAQLQNGTGSSPVLGKVRALLGMGERGLGQRTKLATDN
jgi:pilus assembly protein CpaE